MPTRASGVPEAAWLFLAFAGFPWLLRRRKAKKRQGRAKQSQGMGLALLGFSDCSEYPALAAARVAEGSVR
jgi:hypothetical protein